MYIHHNLYKNRIKLFLLVIFIVYFLFIGRLFFLQIIKYKRFTQLSENNRIKRLRITAPRGDIYDCNNNLIATTNPVYSIYAIPHDLKPASSYMLSMYMGIKEDSLRKIIRKRSVSPYQETRVLSSISDTLLSMIVTHKNQLQGVYLSIEPQRTYLYKGITGHITGYIGPIRRREYLDSLKDKGYSLQDVIGRTGIEKYYEEYLKGKDGWRFVEVDATGRELGPLKEYNTVNATKGNSLYLTIDLNMQLLIDSLFNKYAAGAAVVMDVKTGDILAMYSKPYFNPTLFVKGIPYKMWNSLLTDTLAPLWNRAIQGEYPPGSVFKIFVAAIGLTENIVKSTTKQDYPCTGGMRIGNRTFNCWSKHGYLDLMHAIEQSCDVYFYQLGIKIGLNRIYKYGKSSGFGNYTGIDIPGERKGLLPDSSWYLSKYGKYGFGKGHVANLSIGQGEILLTPLQIASFFSSLANRGEILKPHIVKYIKDEKSKILYKRKIEIKSFLPFEDNVYPVLDSAMTLVVNGPKGTAKSCRLDSIVVMGKTGSSERGRKKTDALFASLAPAEDPEICVVVVVENSGHGGSVAAPIAREIYKYYFNKRGNNSEIK